MSLRLRIGVLAFVAGCVDAIGFLLLFGVFTAQLSGDTTHLAVDIGQGDFDADALARVAVLVVFVLGAVTCGAVLAKNTRHRRRMLMAELGCLVALVVIGTAARDSSGVRLGSAAFYLLVVLAAFSMGVQTALVRHAAGIAVHTTFITGMLVALTEDTVAWQRDRTDREARARITLHGTIWASYLLGGIAGGALQLEWAFWALALPIALLGAVLVAGLDSAREPIT